MRFSKIVGSLYHKIRLTPSQEDLLDTHFTAASHHFNRYKESGTNFVAEIFHDHFFRSHLSRLMQVIYDCGDFSRATDPTGLDLHIRRNWKPGLSNYRLPDPEMFWEMLPDPSFGVGVAHPSDVYLNKKVNLCSSHNLSMANVGLILDARYRQ